MDGWVRDICGTYACTSVEVLIDEQGLLTATEAKRPKMDEVLGKLY